MWDFEIKVVLRAKKFLDIFDGSETLEQQGTYESKIKNWSKEAKCLILMAINHLIKPHIGTYLTSIGMHVALSKIYIIDTRQ